MVARVSVVSAEHFASISVWSPGISFKIVLREESVRWLLFWMLMYWRLVHRLSPSKPAEVTNWQLASDMNCREWFESLQILRSALSVKKTEEERPALLGSSLNDSRREPCRSEFAERFADTRALNIKGPNRYPFRISLIFRICFILLPAFLKTVAISPAE